MYARFPSGPRPDNCVYVRALTQWSPTREHKCNARATRTLKHDLAQAVKIANFSEIGRLKDLMKKTDYDIARYVGLAASGTHARVGIGQQQLQESADFYVGVRVVCVRACVLRACVRACVWRI